MLIACIAILGVGVFAVAPTQNTISGSITINSTNPEVKISAYKYDENGNMLETPFIPETAVRSGINLDLGTDLSFDIDDVNTVEELKAKKIKIAIKIVNPGTNSLGAYFSEKAMTAELEEQTDAIKQKTLTPEADVEANVNLELTGYSEVHGNDEATFMVLSFNLTAFPTGNTTVDLEKLVNVVYLNIEAFQGKFVEGSDAYYAEQNYLIAGTSGQTLTPELFAAAVQGAPEGVDTTKVKVADGVSEITGKIEEDSKTGVFNSSVQEIVLPSEMTTIGEAAFYMGSITELYIPETVTTIGDYAFSWCTGLTTIEVPGNVETIGEAVFMGCSSVTEITLNDGVQTLGERAFEMCDKLKTVNLPASLQNVPANIFIDGETGSSKPQTINFAGTKAQWNSICEQGIDLRGADVVCSDGINYLVVGTSGQPLTKAMVTAALANPGSACVKRVKVADGVKEINGAFDSAEFVEIVLPDGLTTIGENAFSWAMSLTEIKIPNTVTTIGHHAFSGAYNLLAINLPSSLTSIGQHAFSFCYALKSIVIPEGITVIEDGLFYESTGLISVTLPASLQSISADCFDRSDKLETINFAGTKAQWNRICDDQMILSNVNVVCSDGTIEIGEYMITVGVAGQPLTKEMVTTAVNNAPDGVDKTKIKIANGVTEIADGTYQTGVFASSDFTVIILPEGLTKIGNYAFSSAFSLTSLVLPSTVQTIGDYAFQMLSIAVEIPYGVTTIGAYAFTWSYGVSGTLNIPETVTTIKEGAFDGCENLREISLPVSLTEVKNIFSGCTSLTKITYAGTTAQWNSICPSNIDINGAQVICLGDAN